MRSPEVKSAASIVPLEGRDVEMARDGRGDPLIVLESGLTDDLSSWSSVFAELTQRSRVLAYSRPGYGRSSAVSTSRDLMTESRELRQMLGQLNETPPYFLIGHSLGGLIVQAFAASSPQDVCGLITVDAPHPDHIERLYQDTSGDGEAFRWRTAALAGVAREELAALVAPAGGHFAGEDAPYAGPMIILAATQNRFGSQAHQERRDAGVRQVAARYPQAELRRIHCGHYIHRERPLAVLDAIDEVLARMRANS